MKWGNCENEFCEKFRKLYKSKHTDKFVCVPCHDKDPFYHKECSACGKKKKAAMRIVEKIYRKKCPSCDKISPVEDRFCPFCFGQRPVGKTLIYYFCGKCSNNHNYRKGKCSLCGKNKHVHKRTESDEAICDNCYNKNHLGICAECGLLERIVAKTENNNPLGVNCWQRERRKQKKLAR